MRSLWLQGQASLHQASPPLVGSMSSFSPSFIPCPCNPQMLCIGNFFLGFRSQVSTPQCLQEYTHGFPGRSFSSKSPDSSAIQLVDEESEPQSLMFPLGELQSNRIGAEHSLSAYFIIINSNLYFLSTYTLPGIAVGFPGGSVVKNLPANAGDAGLSLGSVRSPGEENGNPLQYSWGSLVAQMVKNLSAMRPEFDPWVGKIPWRKEWLPTPVFWPGEFLKCIIHRVAKSHFHFILGAHTGPCGAWFVCDFASMSQHLYFIFTFLLYYL